MTGTRAPGGPLTVNESVLQVPPSLSSEVAGPRMENVSKSSRRKQMSSEKTKRFEKAIFRLVEQPVLNTSIDLVDRVSAVSVRYERARVIRIGDVRVVPADDVTAEGAVEDAASSEPVGK